MPPYLSFPCKNKFPAVGINRLRGTKYLFVFLQELLPYIRRIHGREIDRGNVKERLAAEDLPAVHPDNRPRAGYQYRSGELRIGIQLQGE